MRLKIVDDPHHKHIREQKKFFKKNALYLVFLSKKRINRVGQR